MLWQSCGVKFQRSGKLIHALRGKRVNPGIIPGVNNFPTKGNDTLRSLQESFPFCSCKLTLKRDAFIHLFTGVERCM